MRARSTHDEAATSREVHLPAGTYYPLLGGAAVQGGNPLQVDAPMTELPAFVPAGTLLVLLPDDVNSLVPGAAGSDVVTHLDAGDDREIWLYPGGESSFTEEPRGQEVPLSTDTHKDTTFRFHVVILDHRSVFSSPFYPFRIRPGTGFIP